MSVASHAVLEPSTVDDRKDVARPESGGEPELTRRLLRQQKQEAARRPSRVITALTVIAALAGLTALVYPHAASWVSALNQSAIVTDYDESIAEAEPKGSEQLAAAHHYNEALSSGVLLAPGANVPQGSGTSTTDQYAYKDMLVAPNNVMARLRIPKIDVDLPIYHGTSDETLLEGAGHLEGTSLPVGGEDTHSVITAHRGLAEATMFTHLDAVGVGDRFTITVFGKVLSYQVISTQVVDPADTETLRQEAGKDLVTLITCTPLGINSHRILVTGERVTPTPDKDVAEATKPAAVQFPWWAVAYGAGLIVIGVYGARSSRGTRGRQGMMPAPESR